MHTSPAATFRTCGVKPCPELPASINEEKKNIMSILLYNYTSLCQTVKKLKQSKTKQTYKEKIYVKK